MYVCGVSVMKSRIRVIDGDGICGCRIRWQVRVLVHYEHVLARTLPAHSVSKGYEKCLKHHHFILLLDIATLLVEGCTLVSISEGL